MPKTLKGFLFFRKISMSTYKIADKNIVSIKFSNVYEQILLPMNACRETSYLRILIEGLKTSFLKVETSCSKANLTSWSSYV